MLLAVGLSVSHLLGPFYGTYRLDPAYACIFDGLGLLQGIRPDNGSSRLEMLIAILRVLSTRSSFRLLNGVHLLHPMSLSCELDHQG
jgi:hypothetical protein